MEPFKPMTKEEQAAIFKRLAEDKAEREYREARRGETPRAGREESGTRTARS
jgi:hypothetical protein